MKIRPRRPQKLRKHLFGNCHQLLIISGRTGADALWAAGSIKHLGSTTNVTQQKPLAAIIPTMFAGLVATKTFEYASQNDASAPKLETQMKMYF